MIRRCALLLVSGLRSSAAPPGIDAGAYARAMVEDVAEILHEIPRVDSTVVSPPELVPSVRDLTWPDVPVVALASPGVPGALRVAAERRYQQAVVVTADAPDLPQLVLAKVFQALDRWPVAVAPADDGGAVAIGAALPAPAWLAGADLDESSPVSQLRAAAGDPSRVRVTPGWHRLRSASDVHRLDPGLEGWESTRAVLAGVRVPGEG